MIDQQELHHVALRLERLVAARATFMPSITGVAQAGAGFGLFSTSTRHMRQLAAMRACRGSRSRGIGIPALSAAWMIIDPFGAASSTSVDEDCDVVRRQVWD
jgi:hypothetical protein